MPRSIAVEEERFTNLLSRVEEVEKVMDTFDEGDPRRTQLAKVRDGALEDSEPVRPKIAAALLRVSERTVRTWAKEGVLAAARTEPRLLLDPTCLHAVLHHVEELRKVGRKHDLLNALWIRLSDQALLDRDDLAESLEQMRAGQGRVIYPKPAITNGG